MATPLGQRRPPDALPLTLLTGFLGAGKTTLLNRLVQAPAFAGAVVIINEFGDVPLDHLLVETADEAMLTLSSGCLCCTVRGDLVATLEDLLRRRDNGRMAPFDRVVIETTGLADPAPILNVVALHPYLMLRFRIEGVITVVDALHGAATLDRFAEAVRQVAMADALVLSKIELVDGPGPTTLRQRLADLNPLADIVEADTPAAAAEPLLAASLFRNASRLSVIEPDPHDHDHDHAHDHGPHDDGVGSLVLLAEIALEPAAADMLIELLRARHGPTLLRVKGLLALRDDADRPLLVQAVQHTLHPGRRLAAWPDDDRRSRLVVIGVDLDAAAIRRLWAAFSGPPRVDQPDSAALSSPLLSQGPGLF